MDMKKILQAMDGVSTKPVEGSNDMSKFVKIVNEGANPHKVALPVQMAMQHYNKPVEKKSITKESVIGKYLQQVEEEIQVQKDAKTAHFKQYAQIIAERVRLKESALKDKDDLTAKRKTLQDLSRNKDVDQKVVTQRKLDLEKEAKQKNLAEDSDVAVANPTDTVTVDIPLLIRLFEYAREDAQNDVDIHNVAERMIALSQEGRTLSMDDYAGICGTEEQ